MRIKIGKSSIRGGELAGGLAVGSVAAQVGVGAVDLLHRVFDPSTARPTGNFIPDPSPGQFIPDPEPRSTARLFDPSTARPDGGFDPSTAKPGQFIPDPPPRSTAQPDTGQFIPDPAPSTAKP
jgi:hypothetical protein